MSQKNLIVNADDFGQSEGINKGIIQAHEKGIVTSASLMVRYPAANEAAVYAKANSKLSVGLHVDLGEWIYSNENWELLYEVVLLKDTDAVRKEIKKQLEAFYTLMDRTPTHIDSHQHVHMREAIRPLFIEIARDLDITLRHCSQKVNYCGLFYGQTTDGSAAHSAISIQGLEVLISKLKDGVTEMACHPGLDDDVTTMYRSEREIEVTTLCNMKAKEMLHEAGIELKNFTHISF